MKCCLFTCRLDSGSYLGAVAGAAMGAVRGVTSYFWGGKPSEGEQGGVGEHGQGETERDTEKDTDDKSDAEDDETQTRSGDDERNYQDPELERQHGGVSEHGQRETKTDTEDDMDTIGDGSDESDYHDPELD